MLKRLTISEALRIAAQPVANAEDAKEAGGSEAEERLEAWSDTLQVLRVMKERGVPDSMKD